MRLVTKAILLLSVVALGVVFLCLAGRDRTPADGRDAMRPRVDANNRGASKIDDCLSPLERAASRIGDIARREERLPAPPAGRSPAAGEGPPRPAAEKAAPPERPRQEPRDLESSAQDEGTVVVRTREEPVLGADPPGPVLRPDSLKGTLVTKAWDRKESARGRSHVVVQGDTLYAIAVRYYGDPRFVRTILAANTGVAPDTLRPGTELVLPDPGDAEKKPAPAEPKIYLVRPGDTLIAIARRMYGDSAMYRRIYEANQDILSSPSATLYPGQKLRLPEPE